MAQDMNPVSWFEIPALDLMRARKFYEDSFGFKMDLKEMGPAKMVFFPMEENGRGAGGTLMNSPGYKPSHEGTLVYFSVDNIDEALVKISTKGGRILTPKQSIGEYGWIAHFEDSEGNKVALHSKKQ